ncbi:hypothetical protein D3C72_1666240 [compost metagenome]
MPEGASFFCVWCDSTMSQFQPASACAARSTSSSSTATPRLKFDAHTSGIFTAAASSACRCAVEMPVVPDTSPAQRSTHSASSASKPSGRLKSIATSNTGAPGNSLAAKNGTPSTTRWAGARPVTAATICRESGCSAASRNRAWPMRPEAP